MSNKNGGGKTPKKVAMGLSGGVDSSVAAYLLKIAGYDVVGVYMQCWDEKADGCASEQDRADAVEVASKLNIKFEHLNFIKDYEARVLASFYKEYEAGRTPNPDVTCNKEIKFGLFMDWALKNGFDFVATGHYARVKNDSGVFKLLKGVDGTKDQSYFLYLLTQSKLSKVIFPIGDLYKSHVREMAKKLKLKTFDKPDSMGICFVGKVNIKEFLKKKIKASLGNVVNISGEVIGRHDGIPFYTIGQRHGFKVTKYLGLPLYVVGKNVEENELIVGFAKDISRANFEVGDLHWVSPDGMIAYFKKGFVGCDVRIRHLGELYSSKVVFESKLNSDEINKHDEVVVAKVLLKNSVFGVAPGQSAVFYLGDEVLGGGIIKN